MRNLEAPIRLLTLVVALGGVHCGPVAASPPDEAAPSDGTPAEPGAAGAPAYAGTGGYPQYVPPGTAGAVTGTGGFGASGAPPVGTAGSVGTGGFVGTDGTNTAEGFINLAPQMGAPLDPQGATMLSPPAPAGWNWYPIDGAMCRDGSPAGIFVHFGTANKLLWYLEGGGACSSLGFCNFNPPNVNSVISGDGQTVLGSALGVVPGRQQPGVFEGGVMRGMFDTANPANPFKDWNMVYTPYCTGDVYFGTRQNVTVQGVATPQQFVGYLNMQKFVARLVPTFGETVDRVILTGASAGGFGSALNFSMVQDSFGDVRVDVLDDSGPPFSDQFMPACMQQRWRDLWGYNDSLPPDCEECFQADGGGLVHLADFLMRKHPKATIAIVSSMQDEIIRLFFSAGLNNCANFATADPVALTLGQAMPGTFMDGPSYTGGLTELRTLYGNTGRLATYYMAAANMTLHQHTWRQRFYEPASGNMTIAAFVTDFLNGTMAQVGP